MDITDIILNDVSGIYQDFFIEFDCLPTSTLEPTVYSGTSGATDIGASHGMVEFTVKMQGVSMAIYKS